MIGAAASLAEHLFLRAPRVHLLTTSREETTRVFALDRLNESGEFEPMSLRHALHFVEHCERAADLGNVRAALKWSFSSSSAYPVGVRLAAAAARMLLELGLVSECRNWCRNALDVIAPPDSGTFLEVGLQEAFAITAMFSTGNGDDVRFALARGIELAQTLGDGDGEVRLLGHLNSFVVRRGAFKEALEIAERSLTAARTATAAAQIRARWMVGFSHHLCGNQAVAEEHSDAALRLEAMSDESPGAVLRRSRGLFSHSHPATLARTLWLRGRADRALTTARTVVDRVASLKHPFEKSSALILCEAIFVWCGEWAEAACLLDALFDLVERYSLRSQRDAALALRGELFVRTGRPREGCALLRTAASTLKTERNPAFFTVYVGALAEGLAATGSLHEALHTIQRAIMEAEQRGGTFDLADLWRVKGVILASQSRDERAADEALSAFSTAIALARSQGALAWELRATTSLAREQLTRGASTKVLADLSAVYARFTEGMETPDLKAARSLLERRIDN